MYSELVKFRGWLAGVFWIRIIAVFPVILLANLLSGATINGSAAGSVVDDTGKQMAGARIVISRAISVNSAKFNGPPVVTGPQAAIALSDKAGGFQVDSLRAGNYVACAQVTIPGWLDPCHWSATATEFTVVAGQKTSNLKITMPRGAIVSIHVDDPQSLLKTATGGTDSECQFHIVTAKGFHYNANIQTSDKVSRDHAITVPFGMPVTLQAIAPHLILNDAQGKATAALTSTLSAADGFTPATIRYFVAGRK